MRLFFLIAISAIFFYSCKKCECVDEKDPVNLTLQPNADEGQDAIVAIRATDGGSGANANHSFIPEINVIQWTYNAQGAGEGTNRSYLKFAGLSAIPAGSEIISAKLSLYGLSEAETTQSGAAPFGNSTYSGSPYTGSNKAWLKRVVGADWNEATINWVNKPSTTDNNQVEIPASTTHYNYDIIDLDVTAIVKDIVNSKQNYGFCFQLQTEQTYRSLSFAASEFQVASKRPKLIIQYK